jgi:hypothetical protein
MSFIKRHMERLEEQRRTAVDICVRTGVLIRCEYHDEVYDAMSGDDPSPYKLGNSLFSQGKLNGVFSTRTKMTEAIKAAIEDAGMECGYCAKD